MKTLILILICLGCFLGAIARGKADKQRIDQLRADWATYLQLKQLDKAIAQYTDDAIFYSPANQGTRGKKAITALYRFVMKNYNAQIRFYNISTMISGEVANDSGDYAETMFDNKTHKVINLKGSYLMALKKQKDGWKISRIMWTEKK